MEANGTQKNLDLSCPKGLVALLVTAVATDGKAVEKLGPIHTALKHCLFRVELADNIGFPFTFVATIGNYECCFRRRKDMRIAFSRQASSLRKRQQQSKQSYLDHMRKAC